MKFDDLRFAAGMNASSMLILMQPGSNRTRQLHPDAQPSVGSIVEIDGSSM